VPSLEFFDTIGTKFYEGTASLLESLFPVEFGLGEELISIADNLFLESLGLQTRQTRTSVAGANPSYARRIVNGDGDGNVNCELLNKGFPYHPVLNIRLGAVAVDAWSVATDYADVVEHGGGIDEVAVEMPLRMGIDYMDGLVSHLFAVNKQNMTQLRHF
jgi:hypothetical protein